MDKGIQPVYPVEIFLPIKTTANPCWTRPRGKRSTDLVNASDLPQTWIFTVTGKRNKTREVPLNPDVVHLLALHAGEFLQEDKNCTDADSLPLIRTLHPSVPQWGRVLEEVNGASRCGGGKRHLQHP